MLCLQSLMRASTEAIEGGGSPIDEAAVSTVGRSSFNMQRASYHLPHHGQQSSSLPAACEDMRAGGLEAIGAACTLHCGTSNLICYSRSTGCLMATWPGMPFQRSGAICFQTRSRRCSPMENVHRVVVELRRQKLQLAAFEAADTLLDKQRLQSIELRGKGRLEQLPRRIVTRQEGSGASAVFCEWSYTCFCSSADVVVLILKNHSRKFVYPRLPVCAHAKASGLADNARLSVCVRMLHIACVLYHMS
jgi:hypothetical protein